MPLMYQQNTLQMEWCLNCHRNPAVNLRPVSEIYNMAWAGPSTDKPVLCSSADKGGATAQNVSCEVAASTATVPVGSQRFTSQIELGKYLTTQYHIRRPDELSSCETCHR
jgi:hypothetical protein